MDFLGKVWLVGPWSCKKYINTQFGEGKLEHYCDSTILTKSLINHLNFLLSYELYLFSPFSKLQPRELQFPDSDIRHNLGQFDRHRHLSSSRKTFLWSDPTFQKRTNGWPTFRRRETFAKLFFFRVSRWRLALGFGDRDVMRHLSTEMQICAAGLDNFNWTNQYKSKM